MKFSRQVRRGAAVAAIAAAAFGAGTGAAQAQSTFTSTEDAAVTGGSCAQAPTTPYGTAVEVSGMTGQLSSVRVGIDDLTVAGGVVHFRALLVAPNGQAVVLAHAQGGYATPVSDVSFSFADGAPLMGFTPPAEGGVYGTGAIQHQLCSSLFGYTTSFPAPAPAAVYGTGLATFNGQDPNGTWRLYVISTGAALDISGWSLTLTAAEPEPSGCADEPVGCWRFGEEAGTTITDSSGNGHDGTYLNGPVLGQEGAPGFQPDTAALFDGVNDLGRIPDAEGLDVGSTFTLEGWIRRSADGRTHAMYNKGDRGLHLVVMNAASGNEVWLRKANVSTLARSSVGIPADGEFHHVVATMDGPGTARIYIDGADVTVPVPGQGGQAIQDTSFPLQFGSGGSTPADFDEFALYDRALDSETISGHYGAGAGEGGAD